MRKRIKVFYSYFVEKNLAVGILLESAGVLKLESFQFTELGNPLLLSKKCF
jgi:hypothetical protein